MKSLVIMAAIAAVGGVAVLGFRHTSEVRGDVEPLTPSETYSHPTLGFSFQYPAGFRAYELPQGEGSETLLVEDPTQVHRGFQVFTLPYDEAGPLTEARIRQDVPDIAMEHVAPVQVAGEPGLSFVQLQDPELGQTYEVWFVHGGTLYEAATYADRAAQLQEVLSTWIFR